MNAEIRKEERQKGRRAQKDCYIYLLLISSRVKKLLISFGKYTSKQPECVSPVVVIEMVATKRYGIAICFTDTRVTLRITIFL